jgi:hypothetical protein
MTMTEVDAAFPLTAADAEAIAQLQAVDPIWDGLARAGDVLAMDSRTILHAGPPLVARPPAPMRNSILNAILFEGWTRDEAEAGALLDGGGVRLACAQDHGAVVPLAAVLSPGMIVHRVRDRNAASRVTYAPLNGGSGPAARLGQAGPDFVAHLHWLNGAFSEALQGALREPMPLIALADAALAAGDDCHGRTVKGSAFLTDALAPTLDGKPGGGQAKAFLAGSPSFFLNLWMAAVKCMARAAEMPGSSIVTAMGGNGLETGLQVGGLAGRWFTAAAAPPTGTIEPAAEGCQGLGAIGDSALVDLTGFGAMAMSFAPEQAKALAAFLPAPRADLDRLLGPPHPGFSRTRKRVGIAVRTIRHAGLSPAIALGILDRAGVRGRIGGGIYAPPTNLFADACDALDSTLPAT